MLRTLTQKVIVATLAFLALPALVALLIIINIIAIDRATDHVTQQMVEYLQVSGHFHEDLDLVDANTKLFVFTRDATYREEVQEALSEAKEALPTLEKLSAIDESTAHFHDKFAQINERRRALMPILEQTTGEVLQAVEVNDPAAITRALEAFKRLDEQAAQFEDDTDALIEDEMAAASATIRQIVQRAIYTAGGGLAIGTCGALLLLLVVHRHVVQPIKALSAASSAITAGDLNQVAQVTNNDEIGDLQQAFNQMVGNLRDQQTMLQARNAELEQSFYQQQQLFETVKQMATPLLPVADDVVVLPIMGHIDSRRAQDIMNTLLHGVAQRRARVAILDITGIADVDTHVMGLLLQAAQAVELLGAQVMLAGISPRMAQVIVEQGIDLGRLRTHQNLRAAIDEALSSRNPMPVKKLHTLN